MKEFPAMESILKGLRVLDLTDEKASFCSRLLADLGARVCKVERTGGDPDRWKTPFRKQKPGTEPNLAFLYHNMNKEGITLNLEHREGRTLFLRLIREWDIAVETFPPGYLEGLGLEFKRLHAENQGFILATVSGFGLTGPRRSYKSCDLVASAFGGHMAVTGSPQGPPLRLTGNQSYYAASLFASCSILLAVRKRRMTGEGEHLDISLQEAVTSTLDHVMIRYFSQKHIAGREGSGHWDHLFFVLPCRDGAVTMTVFQDWETLLELMDRDGAAEDLRDEKWRNPEFRLEHMDYALEILGRWTRRYTRRELFELGQLMRFPWAPVQTPEEILRCPQLKEREYFTPLDVAPGKKPVPFPSLPFRFSGSRRMPEGGAPAAGRDNHRVYRDELGLDEGEIERLASIGAI